MQDLLLMLSSDGGGAVLPDDLGPGPQALIGGDVKAGYFGTIPAADFINGTQLATAVNFTAGAPIAANVNMAWFKFIWNGKIIFSPLRSFRSTVTWNQLYAAGLVYGDNTFGAYPAATPVIQDKTVTFGGRTYRVRLWKTLIGTGVPMAVGSGSGSSGRIDDNPVFQGSEWNSLLYKITTGTQVGETPPNWAEFSHQDASEGWTVCQESSSTEPGGCFMRGFFGFGVGSGLCVSKGFTTSNCAWKPVLELIG